MLALVLHVKMVNVLAVLHHILHVHNVVLDMVYQLLDVYPVLILTA